MQLNDSAGPAAAVRPFNISASGDHVHDIHYASSYLFDVVLLAGGVGTSLNPITANQTPKALVSLVNKPLLWHSVKPWLDAGVRHMFVCAPAAMLEEIELVLSLNKDFAGATFTMVPTKNRSAQDAVSVGSNTSGNSNANLGTCNALRSFLAFKRKLPASDPRAATRDVLVASVDVAMAGIDVWSFVRNFYEGFYSAAAVYYEPYTAFDKTRKQTADVIAIESPTPNSTADVLHCRIHSISSMDSLADEQKPSAGVLARRLQLTFTSAFVDAHTYLMRSWVLEHVDFSTDIESIQYDLFPLLAARQLPRMGADGLQLPHKTLDMDKPIPVHWALTNESVKCANGFTIAGLNAAQDVNPDPWDELRTCATIYRAAPHARIVRIHKLASYVSLTNEILAGFAKPADATALSKAMIPYCEYATASTQLIASRREETSEGKPAVVKFSSILTAPPAGATVASCVVGERVDIAPGATIRNSILLAGSRVASGVTLVNCVLGPGSEATESASNTAFSPSGDTVPLTN